MIDVMESSYSVLPLAAETARKTDRLGRSLPIPSFLWPLRLQERQTVWADGP
jgi:hypothetical protein